MTLNRIDFSFLPFYPNLPQGAMHVQDITELGKRYVDTMQARVPPSRTNATHVVDKMLRNVWNVGYISMMLPQACIIQVVRHPLDTALSCFAQPFEGRGTPWAWDLQGESPDVVANVLVRGLNLHPLSVR